MEVESTRLVLIRKGLSNREAEVAEIVAEGKSSKQAADQLCICEKSIKFHLTSIYKKLKLTGNKRAALTLICANTNLYGDLKEQLSDKDKELKEERERAASLQRVLNEHQLPVGK